MVDQTYTFSLPPVITVEHWEIYTEGEQAYARSCRERKTGISPFLERYHGALALIQRGFVHVSPEGTMDDILKAADQKQTDMRLASIVVMGVSIPVEAVLETPLPKAS